MPLWMAGMFGLLKEDNMGFLKFVIDHSVSLESNSTSCICFCPNLEKKLEQNNGMQDMPLVHRRREIKSYKPTQQLRAHVVELNGLLSAPPLCYYATWDGLVVVIHAHVIIMRADIHMQKYITAPHKNASCNVKHRQ